MKASLISSTDDSPLGVAEEHDCLYVEVVARPPLARYSTDFEADDGITAPLTRLHPSAGRIRIQLMDDGTVEIRGESALSIDPVGSNSFRVYPRDNVRSDVGEAVYPADRIFRKRGWL